MYIRVCVRACVRVCMRACVCADSRQTQPRTGPSALLRVAAGERALCCLASTLGSSAPSSVKDEQIHTRSYVTKQQ